MKKAATPATNITITLNTLLLMAKLPTTQNNRIKGIGRRQGCAAPAWPP